MGLLDNKKSFDLTKNDVLLEIMKQQLKFQHPIFYFIEELITNTLSTKKQIEAQKEAAVEIIKEGAKSNVDELKITLNQEAGLKLKGEIKEFETNIDFKVGQDGNMIVKVKYK